MTSDYLRNLSPDSVLAELPLVAYRVVPDTQCKEVRDYFQMSPTIPGVLVVMPDETKMQAMLSRRRLFERLSRPYALDVFLKRSMAELPDIWAENQNCLMVPGTLRVADGLSMALARFGEDAYEPLVVSVADGDFLLDVGDLLMAHARIFQLAMQLLDRQQQETHRYLLRLEDQQTQIQQYTRTLEAQQVQLQTRSASLEAIQKQLLNLAGVFATQGGQAFRETFAGIDLITQEINRIVQDSTQLRVEVLHICSISEVIGKIANQINLLAFNTAVESERTGSGSKGLGVLASEVRRLARETTEAARDIRLLAQAIQENTERNVTSAQSGAQVATHLREVSQSASQALANMRSLLQELTESNQKLITTAHSLS
ncbi:methyl-accepting chemotaxis protein [Candidatus Cyanaurora vandensis]|uniref:methyl-accepting chemotaxis protein n=1 Tax=Candidatus Cyanaurora vandensis TaxID=2714958 RepID=UPI002579A355|nr:methyl-accepting chemotaxis protein [Candidatus Cyanaurora vandensis]